MAGRKKSVTEFKHIYLVIGLLLVSLIIDTALAYEIYQRNLVKEVPDGDTLQLKDGRRVRLRGVDAPEVGRCLSEEAKDKLESLTKGKHIRLKNKVTDTYGRIVADVILEDPTEWFKYMKWRYIDRRAGGLSPTYINRIMIASGLVSYSSTGTQYDEVNLNVYQEVRDKNIGIFSPLCRQIDPVDECVIKANLRSGKKYYYLSDCQFYDRVVVNQSFGDRWFCEESEALEAGFEQSPSCK